MKIKRTSWHYRFVTNNVTGSFMSFKRRSYTITFCNYCLHFLSTLLSTVVVGIGYLIVLMPWLVLPIAFLLDIPIPGSHDTVTFQGFIVGTAVIFGGLEVLFILLALMINPESLVDMFPSWLKIKQACSKIEIDLE